MNLLGTQAEHNFVRDRVGRVCQTGANFTDAEPRIGIKEIVKRGALGELTQK